MTERDYYGCEVLEEYRDFKRRDISPEVLHLNITDDLWVSRLPDDRVVMYQVEREKDNDGALLYARSEVNYQVLADLELSSEEEYDPKKPELLYSILAKRVLNFE